MNTTTQILNQALECAGKGIMVQDINRRVVFFNQACEKITKWPRGEVLGKDCGETLYCHTPTGTCLKENQCIAMEVMRGVAPQVSRAFLIRRGDGTECWVEMNVSAIHDARGKVSHIVTVVDDIGERKNFLNELIRSKTLSTLGVFASELAHEVKNLVNALTMNMFVLEREIRSFAKLGENPKQGMLEIVSVVQKGFNRISAFVEECLRFAKAGGLEKTDDDMGGILREVVSLLQPQAQLSGVFMTLSAPDSLPKVTIDREKMKQALLNILINGIEAMPDGGKIHVDVKHAGHEIQIECQDTGPGIPEEAKDKIFDLFYTTKKDGTGIGLAVTQNIIHAHGGTIKVASSSKGTCFVVTLPIP